MATPTCENCGAKFPGDPCIKCGKSSIEAKGQHAKRMPAATRKRKKHGRP